MINFSYTYRTTSGALEHGSVAAESRADAMRILGAKSIHPVTMQEGGAVAATASAAVKLPLKNFFIALAVFAVVAIVCFFVFGRSTAVSKAGKKTSKTAQAESIAGKGGHGVAQGGDAVAAGATGSRGTKVGGARSGTRSAGAVAEDDASAAEKKADKPSVFNNASDQVLAMAVGGAPGQDIPPLPLSKGIEEDFKNSLTNKIEILPTDDERVKAIKQAVIETRAQMKEMVDKGYSVEEVLNQHQKMLATNAKARRDAIVELKGIIDSGDAAAAEHYLNVMNTAFQQVGIEPISMPKAGAGRTRRNQ